MKSAPCLALCVAAWLAACASGLPTRLFLLSSAVQTDRAAAADGPPLQLQTVLVPDYLDTTDILMRTGPHEVAASRTGRWGERLSQGITHALQAGLGARLPGGRITLSPPADPASAQLLVTVDAFEAWPDGHCVLSAHWTILHTAADAEGRTAKGIFTSPSVAAADDAARVAAMAAAVDQLSARIALSLQGQV